MVPLLGIQYKIVISQIIYTRKNSESLYFMYPYMCVVIVIKGKEAISLRAGGAREELEERELVESGG